MSYTCPRCGSENVQKLSLAHGSGTMGISATTLSTGLGRGHGGIGIAATQGEAQSLLAKRFAPPEARSAAGSIGCLAVLGFAVAAGAGATLDSVIAFWVVMALTIALAVAFARQATAHNAEQLPKAKALWERRFICLRCEEVFEPQAGSSPVILQADPPEIRSEELAGGELQAGSKGYSIRLLSGGDRPLAAMKVVQDLLGLRIQEAKQLVETAPNTIRSGLSLAEAEGIKVQFEAIGATADILGAPAPVGATETPAGSGEAQKEELSPEPSPAARRCPDCGRSICNLDDGCSQCRAEESANRPVPAWLWAAVALVLVAGIAMYLFSNRSASTPTQVQAQSPVRTPAVVSKIAPPARTLIAEVTVQAGLLGPFEISGTTNLPDGTLLQIWLESDNPTCMSNCGFEMAQTTVRNDRFQTSVKGSDPLPGRYTVHITTAMASAQPPNVEAIFGPSGQNLRGPYIVTLSDGGRKYLPVSPAKDDAGRYLSGFLVYYTQSIEVGEGGEVRVCSKLGAVHDCDMSSNSGDAKNEISAETPQAQPSDSAR